MLHEVTYTYSWYLLGETHVHFVHIWLSLQIRRGFSHLGDLPKLRLVLDGYTILEGNSIDVFRDGDVVTVTSSETALAEEIGGPKKKRKHTKEPVPEAPPGKF